MKERNSVGSSDGLPARHVDAFLDRLRAARYSEVTLGKKRRVLAAFSHWMKSQNIDLAHLDESDAALFMKRLSNAPAPRVQFELAVLRLFLVYLRNEGIVHLPSVNCQSTVADIHDRYVDYLRQERGLTKNSVLVYGPFIRDFLDCQDVGNGTVLPDAFDAVTIRNHLLARSRGRSGEYMRLMTVSLRSFCHFLFLRGYTPHDLYESVPTVRKCRQSSVLDADFAVMIRVVNLKWDEGRWYGHRC
jgi:integrase/recombinase XerD